MIGRRRTPGDGGSVSVELAILLPGFMMLIALAIVTGRQALAHGAVDLAAHDAARAASLSRTADTAQARATAAARDTLTQQGLACERLDVTVNTSEFGRPVGQPASVYASITCVVSFADIALPGVPRSRTVTASFVSPLDQFRSRT